MRPATANIVLFIELQDHILPSMRASIFGGSITTYRDWRGLLIPGNLQTDGLTLLRFLQSEIPLPPRRLRGSNPV